MKRIWLAALIAAPLALAIPLYIVASWKPQQLGLHPIRGKALPPFVAGARPVPPQFDVMLAPDGAHLLSISSQCQPAGLAMWNVERKRIVWGQTQQKFTIWKPLCFSPDGKTLAMAATANADLPFAGHGENPKLALFDVANGQQIAALPVRDRVGYFAGATFSRDGQQLIAATNDEVRTWNVAARRETSRVELLSAEKRYGNFISDVTLAPGGARFLVNSDFVGSTPTPHHLGAEMRDANGRAMWEMPAGDAPRFSFSPDGKSLLVSDQAPVFEMRDAQTGRVRWKKTIANAGFNARNWLFDSSAIVVDIHDEFEIWDAQTGQVIDSIAHGRLQKFVVAPDGARLYYADFNGQIWRQRLK